MIRRAMVMAAGKGLRMRPLTNDRPKPLVTVAGKPLIDHTLDRLVAAKVEMAVINLHYKSEMLREHLARRRDIEIRFSSEEEALLDTGGGVVKALAHFDDEPFFILNSDSIWVEGYNAALAAMNQAWDAEQMDGLLLLASMTTALGYEGWRGDFRLSPTGHVSRVPERMVSGFAYPGVQIAHPRPVRRSAGGDFLHQCDVGPRHRPGPSLSACGWKAHGCMWAAPRRATTPKRSSPSWEKVERHLHDLRRRRRSAKLWRADWWSGQKNNAFALSDVTIYLPTRRAARNFGEAFARVLGGAALLPEFRALGDSDDDDLFDPVHDGLELTQAIHPIRRQLLLATLIRQWEKSAGRRGELRPCRGAGGKPGQGDGRCRTPGRGPDAA